MAFTYTWKVKSLRKRDQVNSEGVTLPGAIVQTFWEVTGTNEDGESSHFSGATPFTAENVPAGSFKAFEDLTEADVIAWIQDVVNNDPTYKAHIDERIQFQIDNEKIEDVDEGSLPWSDGSEVTPPTPEVIEPAPEPDPDA